VNKRPTMRDVAAAAGVSLMAAQFLFGRIAGDTSPPREVVLLTRLIVRGSGEIAPAAP
jgi:LacI family transcriptional regulator, galactose operon repressor